MKLGIIGCGAIGTDVGKAADKMKEIEKIFLFDIKANASKKLCNSLKKAEIRPVKDFLKDADVVFEAASQQAVEEYAELVINAGKDLVIMSVGSLLDSKFKSRIEKIALEKKCKIYFSKRRFY
jgi:aspartate dehydrogenase